jgi:hypothetical protein
MVGFGLAQRATFWADDMAKVSLFHPGADRALRRFRGADAPVTRDDEHLYASGDERPNTGLRGDVVAHAEVNDVIRGCAVLGTTPALLCKRSSTTTSYSTSRTRGVVESTPPPDRCWKKPDP